MIAKGKRTIAIREPDGQLRPLIDGWDGRLTPTAHLLFAKADGPTWSLAAVSFDARSASITGKPDVLAADIAVHYATPVDVTAAGDLFYVGGASRSERRVVTIDATGSQRDVALPPGAWVFMSQIEANTTSPSLKQRTADVRARLSDLILENYASTKRQGAFGSTGLGIYYPSSAAAHNSDPDREGYDAGNTHFPVEFVNQERWATFVREYWKLVA